MYLLGKRTVKKADDCGSVKFTEKGYVLCRAAKRNDEIMVSVTDTGAGISESDRKTVFEIFIQAGDTLTDKPKGTGPGLSICKQIIEYHGGTIWVESQPGQGSTFSFTLPLIARVSPDPLDIPTTSPLEKN